MGKRIIRPQDIRDLALPIREPLYIGIDIGSKLHYAGLVSETLLQRHGAHEACPTLQFANDRDGFERLTTWVQQYTAVCECIVLIEQTGPYHRPLQQYLTDLGIPVYICHVAKRPARMEKSDKRDSLSLAAKCYNQIEMGMVCDTPSEIAHLAYTPTAGAAQLGTLMRRHNDLVTNITRIKNQLTSINAEMFPEIAQAFADPNLPAALAIKSCYPTPASIVQASLEDMRLARIGHYPSDAALLKLRDLAARSIGITDVHRLHTLAVEQDQLIADLHRISAHKAEIEAIMKPIVENSREGQILLSIPGIGPICAAMLMTCIGNIARFETHQKLKTYLGWGVRRVQTGKSTDYSQRDNAGARSPKRVLYMVAMRFTHKDRQDEWAYIYQRLMASQERNGKAVLGRICGQIIRTVYTLLQQDYLLLSSLPPGTTPPAPALYDRARHQSSSRRQADDVGVAA